MIDAATLARSTNSVPGPPPRPGRTSRGPASRTAHRPGQGRQPDRHGKCQPVRPRSVLPEYGAGLSHPLRCVAMDLYDKGSSSFYGHDIKAYDKLYRWTPTKAGDCRSGRPGRPGDVSEQREFRCALQLCERRLRRDHHAALARQLVQEPGYTSVNNSTNVWFTKGIDHLLKACNYLSMDSAYTCWCRTRSLPEHDQ